ncbi:stAR-related lipid transfer protein 5-like [Amphiura filiformis]|uniref:stAR-related lipid transfer protein 5-like n=1 Tax=Amphiura filiformis TaxID=82378 RepID=UPI003B228E34
MADYVQIVEDTRTKLLAIINDEEGWHKCQNVSKIRITSKKSSYFQGNIFKAELEFDAPFDKVAKTWAPKPKGFRQDWDTSITSLECIKDINEEVMIVRTVTPSAAMGLISAREFIDLMMLRFEDDGETAITAGVSVEYPGYPVTDALVRGKNFPCGAMFRKIDAGRSRMTYIGHTSIEGSVPVSLIEAALPSSMHTMLNGLRKVAEKV